MLKANIEAQIEQLEILRKEKEDLEYKIEDLQEELENE